MLLCGLWVRSYWSSVQVAYTTPLKMYYGARSDSGFLIFFQGDFTAPGWPELRAADERIDGYDLMALRTSTIPMPQLHRFAFYWDSQTRIMALSHWVFVLIFAATATFPWLRWRFSFRTLMIVATVVADMFDSAALVICDAC